MKKDLVGTLIKVVILVIWAVLTFSLTIKVMTCSYEIAMLKNEVSILKYQIEVDKFQPKSSSDI